MPRNREKENTAPHHATVKVGIGLPSELVERLKAAARAERRSVSAQVAKMVEEGLRGKAAA